MSGDSSIRFQWFFGRVTSVTAQLFLRVTYTDQRAHGTAPLSPRGRGAGGGGANPRTTPTINKATLTGPRSFYARTLESSVALAPVSNDKTLWQATLEDPCYWTPRQPYLYTLRLTLAAADRRGEEQTLTLGVPVLVARGDRLELEGKNWTLRAFKADRECLALLPSSHQSGTSLYVSCPDEELCELASREGVLLVADLSVLSVGDVEAELRRLARWPAVCVAILPDSAEVDAALRQETSHVVRGQSWPAAGELKPRDWAQILLVPRELIDELQPSQQPSGRAIVVCAARGVRDAAGVSTTATADPATQVALGRQACDSLQAELAGRGSFAGYVVG